MAIAKMKIDGKWINLYANEISARLKKTENLADLSDIALARENLELVGDVDTHHHDSRYLPIIESIVAGAVQNIKIVKY